MRTGHAHSIYAAVWGLTLWSGTHPRGLVCLLRLSFVCATHGANQVVLSCGLKPISRCVVLGPLERDSCAGQDQPLPEIRLVLPGATKLSMIVHCLC